MTLLWFTADGTSNTSPLAERLAADHGVGAIASAASAADTPDAFVLIAQGNAAAPALALARNAGAACTRIVLLAPELSPLPAPEAAPDAPILLLLGTNATRVPPRAAATLCGALPRAHPILVYGAGDALDRERVEAVSAVVNDFIARGEKFIVRAESDVRYP